MRSQFGSRAALLIVLAISASFVLRAGLRPLQNPDEGRYAEIAREMAVGGDWLTPRLHGTPHWAKPPLAYWTRAAAIKAFGANEFAARLPSALASVLALRCIASFARRLGGPRAAAMSALVYATAVESGFVGDFLFGRRDVGRLRRRRHASARAPRGHDEGGRRSPSPRTSPSRLEGVGRPRLLRSRQRPGGTRSRRRRVDHAHDLRPEEARAGSETDRGRARGRNGDRPSLVPRRRSLEARARGALPRIRDPRSIAHDGARPRQAGVVLSLDARRRTPAVDSGLGGLASIAEPACLARRGRLRGRATEAPSRVLDRGRLRALSMRRIEAADLLAALVPGRGAADRDRPRSSRRGPLPRRSDVHREFDRGSLVRRNRRGDGVRRRRRRRRSGGRNRRRVGRIVVAPDQGARRIRRRVGRRRSDDGALFGSSTPRRTSSSLG